MGVSRHIHAQVEYSKLLKNDTIKQLQMGVSTIATTLVQTASTVATFMGNRRGTQWYSTRKLYILEGLCELEKVDNSRKFSFANYSVIR